MKWISQIIAATLLLLIPNAGLAQDLQDISGPFGLPISSAAVERYATQLGLDNDQKQLARALHQGYRGSLRQSLKAGNEEIKALQGGGDRDDRMNKGLEVLDKFADKHQAIELEFFTDLKAILKPDQEPRLESILRARRREVQMRFAFVAGEGVDLIAIFDKLKFKPEPGSELSTHMSDYESSIESLMIEKQKLMRASLRRAFKIQKNNMPDFALVSSIISDLYSLGARVRDTNRRYIRLMESSLPATTLAALTAEVRMRAFPRVYSPSLGERVLDAAKDLPDLTPEQADEIKAITATFTRDLDTANLRYAAAIESTQERLPRDFMMVMQLRDETASDDPLIKARKERGELQAALFKRLRTLLMPEVFAKLPQTDPDRNSFPDFLPNLRTNKEWDDFDGDDDEKH